MTNPTQYAPRLPFEEYDNPRQALSQLSEPQREYLQSLVDEIVAKGSTRLRNAVDRGLIGIKEMLDILAKPVPDSKRFPKCGLRTIKEMAALAAPLPALILEIIRYDRAELRRLTLSRTYPYLTREDVEHTAAYEETHGTLPIRFLAHRYIGKDETLGGRIFRMAYGFDGEPVERQKIADHFQLSAERVRQILTGYQAAPRLREQAGESPLFVGVKELLDSNCDGEFHGGINVSEAEMAGTVFSLFGGKMYRLGEDGHYFLVSPELVKAINPIESYHLLERNFRLRNISDRKMSLREDFVDKMIVDENYRDGAAELLGSIVKTCFGAEIQSDGDTFVVPLNVIDVEYQAVSLLSEKGQPMTLTEIYESMKARFPELKYTDPEPIRAHLNISPLIKAIGRQSTYALAEWDNVSTYSIREWIEIYLKESDTPRTPTEIAEFLEEKGYKTTVNSITGTLASDHKRNYVRYGRRIGIAGRDYGEGWIKSETMSSRKSSFEQNLEEFCRFVDSRGHLPFSLTEDPHEAALNRWYVNVLSRRVDFGEERRARLQRAIAERPDTALGAREFRCKQRCEMILHLHRTGVDVMTIVDIISWIKKERVKKHGDRRDRFFTAMLTELENAGVTTTEKEEKK